MTNTNQTDAEELYAKGMEYNWRHEKVLATNAAVSRASFTNAAKLGHTKALRELAEMMFVGAGGPKEQEHALWLKWSAFARGDNEALEELATLLEAYAESSPDQATKKRAALTANKADEANELLRYVESFVDDSYRTTLLKPSK